MVNIFTHCFSVCKPLSPNRLYKTIQIFKTQSKYDCNQERERERQYCDLQKKQHISLSFSASNKNFIQVHLQMLMHKMSLSANFLLDLF